MKWHICPLAQNSICLQSTMPQISPQPLNAACPESLFVNKQEVQYKKTKATQIFRLL